jgi:hypothetical protein
MEAFMMRYIFLGLVLISFFSCEVKNGDIEYRVKRVNSDEFYSIKLIDKNDVEITTLNFTNNGTILSYAITDGRNFSSVANLLEDNVLAYSINFGNNYSNATNLNVDDELILSREEQVDGNTIYDEKIYKNGLVVKKERTK